MTSLCFGPVVFGGNVFGWTVGPRRGVRGAGRVPRRRWSGHRLRRLLHAVRARATSAASRRRRSATGWPSAAAGTRSRSTPRSSSKRDRPGLSARNIVLAAEDSLRRLRTDHIDLYYAHRDDPEVPQEEYVVAFDSLVTVRQGPRGRGIQLHARPGCAPPSTSPPRQGLAGFTVAQDRWSLVERGIEARRCCPPSSTVGWSSSRMRRWPRGSSPASTAPVRRSTRPAPRRRGSTSTTRAARGCSPRSTRWRRRTTRR